MQELSLLFADDLRVLGEVVTRGGAFSSLTLTAAGETLLGDHVRDWQVHGVPVLHDRMRSVSDDRVMMRDAAFLDALRLLVEARHMALVTLPPEGVTAWEKMSGKKLTDEQRFKKILAFA